MLEPDRLIAATPASVQEKRRSARFGQNFSKNMWQEKIRRPTFDLY